VEVPGARDGAALQPHALPSRVSRSQAGPGSGHAGGEGGDQGGDEEEGGGIQTSWRRFRTAKDFQINYHAQSYFKDVYIVMFQPRNTIQKTICICPFKVY